MYCGEVQVPTEHFSSFLQTAELLQISGLIPEKPKLLSEPLKLSSPIIKRKHSDESEHTQDKKKKEEFCSESDENLSGSETKEDTEVKNVMKSMPVENISNIQKLLNVTVAQAVPLYIRHYLSPSWYMHNIQCVSYAEFYVSDSTYLSKDTNPECECPVCAEKFTSIYALKQHMSFHIGETKCHICGKVMSRLDLLKKHLLAVHKIQLSTTKKLER
ncbi:zinc finger c2h2 type [Holotrichia oblita]|nr:zinc finger c2h2 type [Holotrichia oblita]KAI4470760.1 zinc finger c2h2 type [Holotrichia oblita]